MLSREQRKDFEEQGYMRLPGAFTKAEARAMEDHLWKVLEYRTGARRDAPESWPEHAPSGLRSMKQNPVFQAIGSEITRSTLDDLLGTGGWKPPKNWGQFLVTFPNPERPWTVPTGWHLDFDYLHSGDRLFGAMVFSFLADVPQHAGGTAVLTGSHRLIQQFVKTQPQAVLQKMKRARTAFANSDPWLKALAAENGSEDRISQFMNEERTISNIDVRVEELTGTAGDVVICHPWMLHATSPNSGSYPRFMCIQRVGLPDEDQDRIEDCEEGG